MLVRDKSIHIAIFPFVLLDLSLEFLTDFVSFLDYSRLLAFERDQTEIALQDWIYPLLSFAPAPFFFSTTLMGRVVRGIQIEISDEDGKILTRLDFRRGNEISYSSLYSVASVICLNVIDQSQ